MSNQGIDRTATFTSITALDHRSSGVEICHDRSSGSAHPALNSPSGTPENFTGLIVCHASRYNEDEGISLLDRQRVNCGGRLPSVGNFALVVGLGQRALDHVAFDQIDTVRLSAVLVELIPGNPEKPGPHGRPLLETLTGRPRLEARRLSDIIRQNTVAAKSPAEGYELWYKRFQLIDEGRLSRVGHCAHPLINPWRFSAVLLLGFDPAASGNFLVSARLCRPRRLRAKTSPTARHSASLALNAF